MESRPPFPPFTAETAAQKVRGAEDGWNGRNPEKVALALPMNIKMQRAIGFAPMAMKTGYSQKMAKWPNATPALMTSR